MYTRGAAFILTQVADDEEARISEILHKYSDEAHTIFGKGEHSKLKYHYLIENTKQELENVAARRREEYKERWKSSTLDDRHFK